MPNQVTINSNESARKAVRVANATKYEYNQTLCLKGWNKNWDEWVGEARIMKQVFLQSEIKAKL